MLLQRLDKCLKSMLLGRGGGGGGKRDLPVGGTEACPRERPPAHPGCGGGGTRYIC